MYPSLLSACNGDVCVVRLWMVGWSPVESERLAVWSRVGPDTIGRVGVLMVVWLQLCAGVRVCVLRGGVCVLGGSICVCALEPCAIPL